MLIAENLMKNNTNKRCYFCKTLLNSEVSYENQYNISCCKSNFCKQKLNLSACKIIGVEAYTTILENSIKKDDLDKYLPRLNSLVDLGKLSNNGYRRMRYKPLVFYKETTRGRLVVGLNYAYCVVDNGLINRIYNLNEKKESLSSIKERLSTEFLIDLDIFLKVLDCRKVV